MSAEQQVTKYENIPFSPTVETVVFAVTEDCIPSGSPWTVMDVFLTRLVIFLLTLHSVRGPVKLVLLCDGRIYTVRQPGKLLLLV